MELQLPVKDSSFDLAKAVCSHGLFMMAPNRWDPITRSLFRPLRFSSSSSSSAVGAAAAASVTVRISQPSPFPSPLVVFVFVATSLSSEDQEAILAQVRRMLRISDDNDRRIREFHELHIEAKVRGFGRVFRSPTLFEDMVKCILLCNCQWPRTLSMAKALCEFQLESEHCEAGKFCPKTPQLNEPEKKRRRKVNITEKLENQFDEKKADLSEEPNSVFNHDNQSTSYLPKDIFSDATSCTGKAKDNFSFASVSCINRNEGSTHEDEVSLDLSFLSNESGDFPCPEELAAVDAEYLAKHCKLGYRSQRIVSLAKDIVEHKIQYRKLEEVCNGSALSTYEELDRELSDISGFGPFTRANVLMCMGFYHKIPADTETLRHLKQYHARNNCTNRSIEWELDEIYGKHAPFQFLAYWFELWAYYEERFGNTIEMPQSHYPLISKSNMKN